MRQGHFLDHNPFRTAFVAEEVARLRDELAEFPDNQLGHPEADAWLLDWAPDAILDA